MTYGAAMLGGKNVFGVNSIDVGTLLVAAALVGAGPALRKVRRA